MYVALTDRYNAARRAYDDVVHAVGEAARDEVIEYIHRRAKLPAVFAFDTLTGDQLDRVIGACAGARVLYL